MLVTHLAIFCSASSFSVSFCSLEGQLVSIMVLKCHSFLREVNPGLGELRVVVVVFVVVSFKLVVKTSLRLSDSLLEKRLVKTWQMGFNFSINSSDFWFTPGLKETFVFSSFLF